jgi:branched-chain amino acid transport system substrate-binding protein
MSRFQWTRSLAALAVAMSTATLAQAEDIKIGIVASLTGGAGQYGIAIKQGFELAAEEINAAGGVGGNKLALLVEDDQGKKEEGMNVFKKLIHQNKVIMVFGPTLSNTAAAAHPIAQQAKTVAFGTSTTVDGITAVGDYIFRNAVTEATVLPQTLKMATRHTGLKKVAVIYGNDDVLTKNGYDNFKKALQEQQIAVTTTETYAKGDVDFKAQLTKIKASGPDAVVMSVLIAEGGPIVAQARQLGIALPMIGGNGMNSARLFELAPGKASDNVWVGGPWSLASDTPENRKFVAAYQAKYKVAPDQFAAQAYDAMYIAAEGLRKTRLTGNIAKDRAVFRDALPTVKITGATGPFAFEQVTGRGGKPAGYDAVQKAIVMKTAGGQYVIQH